MLLSTMVQKVKKSSITEELLERCLRPSRLIIRGAGRSARALVASSIAKRSDRPILIIVPTLEEAARWHSHLQQTYHQHQMLHSQSQAW